MTNPLSYFEASRDLKEGDRVRFTEDFDVFDNGFIVPAGTEGTVTYNGLNEMTPRLDVLPDSPELREKLKLWDGEIYVYGPEQGGEEWQAASPLVKFLSDGEKAARARAVFQRYRAECEEANPCPEDVVITLDEILELPSISMARLYDLMKEV